MHYPHKLSRIKKLRKVGFRARMRTSKGRRIINRRRRLGRTVPDSAVGRRRRFVAVAGDARAGLAAASAARGSGHSHTSPFLGAARDDRREFASLGPRSSSSTRAVRGG